METVIPTYVDVGHLVMVIAVREVVFIFPVVPGSNLDLDVYPTPSLDYYSTASLYEIGIQQRVCGKYVRLLRS